MREHLVHFLDAGGLPPEWVTLVISTLPIIELRGAIPYAIGIAKLDWQLAYVLAVVGNIIPVIPLLLYLGPVSNWLRRFGFMDRFFDWLFARTRRKSKAIERYGSIGLIVFVAIPLPVTGAWTGSAAAFIFGIPFRTAFPIILVGVGIAGALVTAAVQAGVSLGGLVFSG